MAGEGIERGLAAILSADVVGCVRVMASRGGGRKSLRVKTER